MLFPVYLSLCLTQVGSFPPGRSPPIVHFRGQNQQVMGSCNNFLGPPYSVPGLGFISCSVPLFPKYTTTIFILQSSNLPFQRKNILLLDFGVTCPNPQNISAALTELTSNPVQLCTAFCGEEPEQKGGVKTLPGLEVTGLRVSTTLML